MYNKTKVILLCSFPIMIISELTIFRMIYKRSIVDLSQYIVWNGDIKILYVMLLWNFVNLFTYIMYFFGGKLYEKLCAPIIVGALTLFLFLFPIALPTSTISLINDAATFKYVGRTFVDFVLIYMTKCHGSLATVEICKNFNSDDVPYGTRLNIFGLLNIESNFAVAMTINAAAVLILVFVSMSYVGIKVVPIILTTPWLYFALERANIDLIFLIIFLLLLRLSEIRRLKIILEIFLVYFISIKPIFIGYFIPISRKRIPIFVFAIFLTLFSFNFSISKLKEARNLVQPTPYGGFGNNYLLNIIDNFEIHNAVIAIICVAILITLFFMKNLIRNYRKYRLSYQTSFETNYSIMILIILCVGNQVNYKLLILAPIMLINFKNIDEILENRFLLINFACVSFLYSFGQHTFLRASISFLLSILICIRLAHSTFARFSPKREIKA